MRLGERGERSVVRRRHPLHLLRKSRPRHTANGHPRVADHVAGCRQVPDLLGSTRILLAVIAEDVAQVLANRSLRPHVSVEFRGACQQVRRRAVAGNVNQRNAAGEHGARGNGILIEIELPGVIAMLRLSAQPDDDNPAGNLRRRIERRGNVGQRPNRHDPERTVPRLHRSSHQIVRGRIGDRADVLGEESIRSAMNTSAAVNSQAVQQAVNLRFGIVQPLSRRVPLAQKQRGIDRLQLQAILRQQRMNHRELVVNLVGRVGVQHHRYSTRRSWRSESVVLHAGSLVVLLRS